MVAHRFRDCAQRAKRSAYILPHNISASQMLALYERVAKAKVLGPTLVEYTTSVGCEVQCFWSLNPFPNNQHSMRKPRNGIGEGKLAAMVDDNGGGTGRRRKCGAAQLAHHTLTLTYLKPLNPVDEMLSNYISAAMAAVAHYLRYVFAV